MMVSVSFEVILQLVLFILPAYFANAVPVVLGGGQTFDFGKNFSDGKRIFGDGKTIRGFLAGVICGTFIGVLEAYFLPNTALSFYPAASTYILAAFLLSFGALFGDLVGSFIKRRLGMQQGDPSLVMDELTFLFIALLLAYPYASHLYSLAGLAFLVVLTYLLHKLMNYVANRLGLKKVPW